ncbi:thiol-disulfide oxidoreductase [Salimicrobium jeotgali]|uniref:Thiol-disulfide oxidoreductase n=2 Tax=Salimicrobium TaxID=351195 RepID=K2HAF6_9BACI|nr:MULTISPECIES: thiol-disulfide oxidoreductase ResA [Salimicrobium]AKG04379.1 thiol-disulfide oxidoreductase [Salimicrobium jeotgali]EKE32570.1 thiol-disulfide oxidoreductase [Salimicrobium jeotgali]MBM7695447.1 peroxiredoxin [Salimicrobium jeotgali]PBB05494.1 thiol-disulfide oxidoreductase [Salimicrobium humidisoli]
MSEKTVKKKKKRLIFRSTLLVIMLSLVVFAVASAFQEDGVSVEEGEKAPNFALKKFGTDETVELEDYRGKGVMINFWATYCEPCKDEMPYMEELYPKYKKKGVEILAINLDTTDIVVEQFMREYQLTFPILQDKDGQVMNLYNIGPIPSTLFIGPDGKIEETVIGPLTLSKLEGHLQDITPSS